MGQQGNHPARAGCQVHRRARGSQTAGCGGGPVYQVSTGAYLRGLYHRQPDVTAAQHCRRVHDAAERAAGRHRHTAAVSVQSRMQPGRHACLILQHTVLGQEPDGPGRRQMLGEAAGQPRPEGDGFPGTKLCGGPADHAGVVEPGGGHATCSMQLITMRSMKMAWVMTSSGSSPPGSCSSSTSTIVVEAAIAIVGFQLRCAPR